MAELGKPLAFYLKYMAEMERLCDPKDEGGDPDLVGLDHPEQVQSMALAVGDAASVQAADFLEECGAKIKDHFIGLGVATLDDKKKRATIVKNWDWEAGVNVSSLPDGSFSCGVLVS